MNRVAAVSLLGVLLLGGCLGEPEVEDRWTRLDIHQPDRAYRYVPGETTVAFRGAITYRAIRTGELIAEIRWAPTVPPDAVALSNELDRMQVLADVQLILDNSVSLSAQTMPVTGWDHLVHTVDFAMEATLPSAPVEGGVYVVFYLGEAEDVEMEDGTEITVLTPVVFEEAEVLPMAMPLIPASVGALTQ